MVADFAGAGMSTGPHPMAFVRPQLDQQGITRAGDLAKIPSGQRARVAGVVIVRQRPGSAKGFVFITIEDETGFANAIITPRYYEANRHNILGTSALLVAGIVQNQDGVLSIKADRFSPLPVRFGDVDVARDFH
jgi:error-prone DNA polymerase